MIQLKDVPDVHALLDHPVARTIAAAQPAAVAADRAVAAGPGGTGLDQGPQLTPADQLDSLAKPRVRPALKPDVNGQLGGPGRLGDQPIAAGERDPQRLFRVEVLAGRDRVGNKPGSCSVARKGDDDRIDVVTVEDPARIVVTTRAAGPRAFRRSPAPRCRCLGSVSQTATIGVPGQLEHAAQEGRSRDCRRRSRPAAPG